MVRPSGVSKRRRQADRSNLAATRPTEQRQRVAGHIAPQAKQARPTNKNAPAWTQGCPRERGPRTPGTREPCATKACGELAVGLMTVS
jgi:hypothetical protein